MVRERASSTSIRTPDQRLRVFVSSTLGELADERAVVSRAIASLHLTPVMFELGARSHPPQELYRAYLAQSDVFVGLYWQRYGWVGPGMDISGLEDEFQLSRGMPRLLYVKSPAPDREEGLAAMIRQIQAEGTDAYKSFRSNRELGRLIRDDLATLLSERFVSHAEGSAPSEPARDTPVRPRSLPYTSTSLVGRDEDIARVTALLEDPNVRLVTLTGPGGIGKTRLAVAAGERLSDSGLATIFVPLASVDEPGLVLPRIAAVAGASLEGANSPLDVLVAHLADTPTLLVLDNLEQVIGVGPDLDALLARCPSVKILATSRAALRVRAEHEDAVSPLAVPPLPEHPTVDDVAALPAVRLFVDRAQAAQRTFTLTSRNAPAVAEICRRLDGIPLAIELAAARTRLLSPADLLLRLKNRLDALGSGPADLPERQRTLRQTIEWSVGLLDDAEREMLATLSVFADGWTLDACVQVAGAEETATLDLLDALCRHSLVSIKADEQEPRFVMLETIREFAVEMAGKTPDIDAVRERHAAYFGDFVEQTEWPYPTEAEWAERLQAEEGNVRSMVVWSFDHDITSLPHVFRTLWRFWQLRDRMTEWRAWLEVLLPRAATFDSRTEAELWLTYGMTAAEAGDDDGALAAVAGMQRLTGRFDDPELECAIQLAISWILPINGDIEGALQAAVAAETGFRQLGKPFMAANATFTLGMLELARGSHDAAGRHLTQARTVTVQPDATSLTAVALIELSTIAVATGRPEEALPLLVEGLDVTIGAERSTMTVSFCLAAFARLALARGDARMAATALGAAEALRTRAGLRAWPMVRPTEAVLRADIEAALDSALFNEAYSAGGLLSRAEAVALVRGSGA